jgi:hypothetical protein
LSAEFYIKPEGSYIRFGEIEEIVSDSQALLINDRLQHMILYNDAKSVISQFKRLIGMDLPDSALISFSKNFTGMIKLADNNTSIVEVNSRALITNTSLSRQTIAIEFLTKTKMPLKVTMVNRSLLPLPNADTSSFIAQFGRPETLIATKDQGYYLLKEQTSTFIYKKIEHEGKIELPVVLSDRIIKRGENEYAPVKAYEAYMLDQNF